MVAVAQEEKEEDISLMEIVSSFFFLTLEKSTCLLALWRVYREKNTFSKVRFLKKYKNKIGKVITASRYTYKTFVSVKISPVFLIVIRNRKIILISQTS